MDNTNCNESLSIYVLDVSQVPAWTVQQLYEALPRIRQERADRLLQPAARACSICAAALLYAVLDKPLLSGGLPRLYPAEELTGPLVRFARENGELDWAPDANGNPFPEGVRRNGELRYVSLSHSGGKAAAAVAACPVGLDIQADNGLTDETMRRILAKGHQEEQSRMPPAGAALGDAFFRWWTMKESVMKLTGMGLKLPLGSFSLRPVGNERWQTTVQGRPVRVSSRKFLKEWIAWAQWEGDTP